MKIPDALKSACQVLRARVRFDGAILRFPGAESVTQNDTPVIRESTRLYTESWITPLIDAIETGDLHRMRSIAEGEPGHPIGIEPGSVGRIECADLNAVRARAREEAFRVLVHELPGFAREEISALLDRAGR